MRRFFLAGMVGFIGSFAHAGCYEYTETRSSFKLKEGDYAQENERLQKSLIAGGAGNVFFIHDHRTGKDKVFKKGPLEFAVYLPSGEVGLVPYSQMLALWQVSDKKQKNITMKVLDPETGKSRSFTGNSYTRGGLWSIKSQGKNGVDSLRSSDGKTTTGFARRKDANVFEDPSGTGPQIEVAQSGTLRILAPGSTEPQSFTVAGADEQLNGISSYRADQVIMQSKNLIIVVNPQSGTIRKIPKPENFYLSSTVNPYAAKNVSADGKKLILTGIPEGVFDLETGVLEKLPNTVRQSSFAANGDICSFDLTLDARENPSFVCLNPTTLALNHKYSLPPGVSGVELSNEGILKASVALSSNESQSLDLNLLKQCGATIAEEDFFTCSLAPPLETGLAPILSVAKSTRCAMAFQPGLWPETMELKANQISDSSTSAILQKYSKPGGFKGAQDMDTFNLLIHSGAMVRYPALVNAATLGVLHSSPALYEALLANNPELSSLAGKPSEECLNPSEKAEIKKAALTHAMNRLNAGGNPIKITNLVAPLIYDRVSEEEKAAIADKQADKVVAIAGREYRTKDIFPYKVHLFARNEVGKYLGLPSAPLSDLTAIREGNSLTPAILSTTPRTGAFNTQLGFYLDRKPSTEIARLPKGRSQIPIAWEQDGQKYLAKIEVERPLAERSIIPESPSPDYASMWKNNQLRGLVIVGSNMENNLTDKTVNSYVSYYLSEGFKFEKPEAIADMPGLLAERIKGKDQAQYFIKEAHSDGDEKNLFELYRKGKILKGTRVKNGKKEEIEIAYSTEEGPSEKFANAKFGELIKEREKNGGSQFLYLNSSCWSASKAVQEISSAYSPLLINIPTSTTMDEFADKRTNVMRIAVDGIRNQRSYEAIRKQMEADHEYADKSSNVFLFPDEPAYKEKITDKIGIPARISPQLYKIDAAGAETPYSIDD